MQFDIDHSTPYYRAIFGNLTEDQMIDNIDAMKTLSTYHKKQHYLLKKTKKRTFGFFCFYLQKQATQKPKNSHENLKEAKNL